MLKHPTRQIQHSALDVLSNKRDPLHLFKGTRAKLGSFIDLKSTPNISHICVKKGVQAKALLRLAQHIVGQARSHPTSLKLQRTRKGKYSYKVLYSSKRLGTTTVNDVYETLLKLTKKQPYLTLVLKPNSKGGSLHTLISQGISLL